MRGRPSFPLYVQFVQHYSPPTEHDSSRDPSHSRDAAYTAICIPRPWTMLAGIFSPVGGAAANKENDFSCSSLPTLISLSFRVLTTRLDTTITTSAHASPLHLLPGQRKEPGHECRGYPQHLSPSALRSLRVHLVSKVLASARPAMQPFDLQTLLAPRKSSSARDLPTPVSVAVPRHGQSLPEGASMPKGWGADSCRRGCCHVRFKPHRFFVHPSSDR